MRAIGRSGWGWVACFTLCCLAQPLLAATAVSPKIGGSWAGTISGNSYSHTNDGTTTTPVIDPIKTTATATLTQNVNDLTVDMVVVTNEGPLAFSLAGRVGDFAFWARGTHLDTDGTTQQLFMSGHFTAKGNKIVGNVLVAGGDITFVTYSMSKTTGAAQTRAYQAFDTSSPADSTDPPFNVGGKAAGKTYTFATNAKAGKYAATVSGAFTPTAGAASLTFTAADGTQTFDGVFGEEEHALALLAQSGSDTLIVFLKTGQTSGAGTGWIFSDTRLVEFKIAAKQQ